MHCAYPSLSSVGQTRTFLTWVERRTTIISGQSRSSWLLGASIDIRQKNSRNYSGTTSDPSCRALDMAASRGFIDIVRALLRHGSSVSSSDRDRHRGYTTLHHAAEFDDPGDDRDNGDVIRVLLEAGADIEAKEADFSSTPLHLAACKKTAESGTIRALLEGGANVNARDEGGGTPLHDACCISCLPTVEALVRWGADEELTNEEGDTAEKVLGTVVEGDDDEEERIRHMLACAPSDRSWRRRGWLVLARSCPAKMQLKVEGNSDGGGSSNDSSGKIAKASSGGEELRDGTADLVRLVGRVVNLNVNGLFRLVVGFL